MSESKKVIHVKDLIIKADNVHFEPTPTPHTERPRPFDAFFGGVRRPQPEPPHEERIEAEEEKHEEQDDEEEGHQDKRPFSWL
ncbi:hypothetical protein Pryu01_01655 [Paraliobacillus ryukyuensis]|uniref:Uncharacterized protein n=1 Tax=Paraliobacillus ryukyuensis TaxID=200904 RepID=A0A366E704_9BACI|nr:hypothetical protein [Paraliobacillus ryukyuensis]RBO98171.1 hypothetical protein DES48_10520 [Paraliobacillus ryukyuensis]